MVGDSDAAAIAEIALEEALKYVAQKVYLPALVASATYTWGVSDTEASLSSDFGISDFETPVLLLVAENASSTGVPYVFREWLEYEQIRAVPGGIRVNLTSATSYDERPDRVYTLNPSNELIAYPIKAGNVLTLYYRKSPAAYSDAGTPEMPSLFDSILVNGAVMYLKEYIREPEQIINPYKLFKDLDEQIEELDHHLKSQRQRRPMKLSARYRIPK